MLARFLTLFVTVFVFASHSYAVREVVLANRLGVLSWNYNQLVQSLGYGTHIKMGGQTFISYGVLGIGGRNIIIDIGDGKALRIPKVSDIELQPFAGLRGLPPTGWTHPGEYITSYLNGYRDLQNFGAQTVRVYPELSRPGLFAVIEKVDVLFNLNDFLHHQRGRNLSFGQNVSRDQVLDRLVEFAESYWAFKKVGDFRAEQIAWTGERWVLLDWTHLHEVFGRFNRAIDFVYPESHAGQTLLRGIYANLFALDRSRAQQVSDFFDAARRANRSRLPIRCVEALTGVDTRDLNPFRGD